MNSTTGEYGDVSVARNISSSFHSVINNATTSCIVAKPLEADFRVVLFCILIAISIMGNMLVIFVVIRNKRMQSVANYLICNMSIADLIITFLPMIWEVVKLRHYPDQTWPMGRFMCSFTYMCIYISVACSILSLMLISFDRFFAVLYPLRQSMTKQKLPFLLVAIWIASFAFASPMIYAQDLYTEVNKTYCIEIWKPPFDSVESPKHYTVILFVGLYAIPLVIMAVLYTAIVVKLWRRNIPGNRSSKSDLQAIRQKRKVVKMLVCVVTVFAICWFPVFFAQFMFFFSPTYTSCPGSFPHWLQFLGFFMQYLGSAVNPFIYFTFSKAYRVGFRCALGWRPFSTRDSRYPTFNGSFAMTIVQRRTMRNTTVSPNMAETPQENEIATISHMT